MFRRNMANLAREIDKTQSPEELFQLLDEQLHYRTEVERLNRKLGEEINSLTYERNTFRDHCMVLQAQLNDFNVQAHAEAEKDERLKVAENVGRTAGRRMDALETFLIDLHAGGYDQEGTEPIPTKVTHEDADH